MSTYSSNLRIELITTGTQAGTWGSTTNDNYQYVLEQAITGSISVTTASANEALTYLNGPTATASANSSIRAVITLNTSSGANFAVYAPPASKLYVIKNSSAYTATIYNSTVIGNTTAAGSGVAVPAGQTMTIWSDGANFYQQNTSFASPSLTGTPIAPTATAGTNTTQIATTAFVTTAVSNATGSLGTMSTQNANNVNITGGSITGITDLAVADGGTGASNASGARTNLGLVIGTDIPSPTGTGASGTWNINVTGNAATVTNGLTTGNYNSYAPTLTGGGASGTWGINISGNAATATSATSATSATTATSAGTVTSTINSGVTGTTQATSDSSTKIATTAFVKAVDIGWGQTWQDVTASRAKSTDYTNNTGKPILVQVYLATTVGASSNANLYVDGVLVSACVGDTTNGAASATLSAIVPSGSTYKVTGSKTLTGGFWVELR